MHTHIHTVRMENESVREKQLLSPKMANTQAPFRVCVFVFTFDIDFIVIVCVSSAFFLLLNIAKLSINSPIIETICYIGRKSKRRKGVRISGDDIVLLLDRYIFQTKPSMPLKANSNKVTVDTRANGNTSR